MSDGSLFHAEGDTTVHLKVVSAPACVTDIEEVMHDQLAKTPEVSDEYVSGIFNYALGLQNHQHWREAEKFYRQILRLRPGLASATINICVVLRVLGKHWEAVRLLFPLAEWLPENPSVLLNLGNLMGDIGYPWIALQLYKRIPNQTPQVLNAVGKTLYQMDRHDEAKIMFTAAIKGFPEFWEAYANRACCDLARQRFSTQAWNDWDMRLRVARAIAQ